MSVQRNKAALPWQYLDHNIVCMVHKRFYRPQLFFINKKLGWLDPVQPHRQQFDPVVFRKPLSPLIEVARDMRRMKAKGLDQLPKRSRIRAPHDGGIASDDLDFIRVARDPIRPVLVQHRLRKPVVGIGVDPLNVHCVNPFQTRVPQAE